MGRDGKGLAGQLEAPPSLQALGSAGSCPRSTRTALRGPGGPVPPDLLVHVVVVGQAPRLVQRILLHAGISRGLGWGKERGRGGGDQGAGGCPVGPGRVAAGRPYLSAPPAPPCRTPPRPGSWLCRCRPRCRARRRPAPPGSTRCPRRRSSGGCSPPAAPRPGGTAGVRGSPPPPTSSLPTSTDAAPCTSWGGTKPKPLPGDPEAAEGSRECGSGARGEVVGPTPPCTT